MAPFAAALAGAREVGFTVLSMSLSLIAVFIPILLMGGIVGRLFREFAVTLSAAILVSLVVSLTTTPMMCARLLRPRAAERPRPVRIALARARLRGASRAATRAASAGALRHGRVVMLVLLATVVPQRLPVRGRFRRASSRSRTPAGWSAASRPTRASRSRRCSRSSPSFMAIVRRRPGGGERGRLHRRRPAQLAASCSSR